MIKYFDELNIDKKIEVLKCFEDENKLMLFQEFRCNLYNEPEQDEELKQYYDLVKKRIKFINKHWLFDWECHWIEVFGEMPDIVWYHPQTKEEIASILKRNYGFTCIIMGKSTEFKDIDYIIDHAERHTEEFDGYTLDIYEKRSGHFLENVIPRLKLVDSNLSF
jgi:hypothetical protein